MQKGQQEFNEQRQQYENKIREMQEKIDAMHKQLYVQQDNKMQEEIVPKHDSSFHSFDSPKQKNIF